MSYLEQLAYQYFIENKIDFEQEVYINYEGHHMFVDFVLKNNNKTVFIELNGQQHYIESTQFTRTLKEQQDRDARLQKYCDENHIQLY